MNEQVIGEEQRSGKLMYRVKFIALVSVFFLPFVASWLAFYVFDYRPPSKNYGELVEPVRAMKFAPMTTIDGKRLTQEFWKKWTFVLLDDNGCQQLCRDNLYYLRQMRIALGRDADRVQNLAIFSGVIGPELKDYFKDFPRLSVVNDNNRTFFNEFDLPGKPAGNVPRLYLIDPAGNLMMTFPARNDPKSILSDMRRLLKVSQIG
jgi:hypothetical protein